MDHLKNLIAGARHVLVLNTGRDYIRPRSGFARDAAALRGDFARVAAGLGDSLRKHGQPVDNGKR
jgi:hypothetical protein